MKYAIIEDEDFARENLREIITKIRPQYELVGTPASVEESLSFFQTNEIDLLFMDIELGDGTCFDIIENSNIKIPIIFTTAYNEYILKAFKVNSIDYLLKPITEDHVKYAIDKLEQMADIFTFTETPKKLLNQNKVNRILISKNQNFTFLNISDIAFFCTENRYVMAYTKSGICEVTDIKNMEEIMTIVSNHDFFQLSRSVVASISAIRSINKIDNQRLQVIIHAGQTIKEIIISANRRKDFLSWLGQ